MRNATVAAAVLAALAALAVVGLLGWAVLLVLALMIILGLIILAAEVARPIMRARRQLAAETIEAGD